uniref:Transposase n=1 Tax=Heterorhabditis bacteriophora TaxID=37862 RepID=A0A1I7WS11_HETBA
MISSELKKCKLWWNVPAWLKITSYIVSPVETQERIVTMPIQEKNWKKRHYHPYKLAELDIIRWIQNNNSPPPNDKSDLQLYYDKDRLWRCGGCLQNSTLPEYGRRSIYIPHNSKATGLLILEYPTEYQHSRATFTLAQIRQNTGFLELVV